MFIVPEDQDSDMFFDLFKKGYSLGNLAENIIFNDGQNITLNLVNDDDLFERVEMDIKQKRTITIGSISTVCICADEAFVFEFFEGGERIGRIVAVSSDKLKHNIRRVENETIGFIFRWIFDVCTEKEVEGVVITTLFDDKENKQTVLSFPCSKTSISTETFYKFCL